jgi:hypothetical protein
MNLTQKPAIRLILLGALLTLLSAPRTYAAAGEWGDANSDASWSDSNPSAAAPTEEPVSAAQAPVPVASEPSLPKTNASPDTSVSPSVSSSASAPVSSAPTNVAATDSRPAAVPTELSIAATLILTPNHLTSISKVPTLSLMPTSPFVHSEPRAAAPFPLLLNQAVRSYVEDFLDQPKGLELAFARSRPFFSEMVDELKAQGVPDDLVYLTFAESDFSKAGKGPWQFTFNTAARFGLHVNKWLDERRDPILSTRAAAEYLAELHDQADNDWRVAVIGWNTGEANINRYWLLEGSNYTKFAGRLPRRTRQLLNRFMAVAFIAHNSATYGIDVDDTDGDIGWTTQRFRGGTLLSSIARKFETTVSKLHDLNPALRTDRVPPNLSSYIIRVPSDDDDSY